MAKNFQKSPNLVALRSLLSLSVSLSLSKSDSLFSSPVIFLFLAKNIFHCPLALFLNGPTTASFSFIFGLFKQTIQFLQQINVKKCPSSIQRQDSNPQPFKHELSPITTRPGLPPKLFPLSFNLKVFFLLSICHYHPVYISVWLFFFFPINKRT